MYQTKSLFLFPLEPNEEPLIWHPVLKFDNYIEFEPTKRYGGTRKTYSSFTFYPFSQYLMYGEEFRLTLSCPFHFANYPFDSHECRLEFGDDQFNSEMIQIVASMVMYENTMIGYE